MINIQSYINLLIRKKIHLSACPSYLSALVLVCLSINLLLTLCLFLCKMLDSVVIKLEGGTDLDLTILDYPDEDNKKDGKVKSYWGLS